ncbi:hypothetical protein EC973_005491 [Apophysomyces ossiformis]|uniref:Heterokaryon incompatibility domain-containing protein n=1 Tax=Apophysomyces ossiformis TaxID=679940 RepID=A0A8H7BF05_9FUNG|nr:hypothetical protein EC973_005491 [Apophysomyces ossiformis]
MIDWKNNDRALPSSDEHITQSGTTHQQPGTDLGWKVQIPHCKMSSTLASQWNHSKYDIALVNKEYDLFVPYKPALHDTYVCPFCYGNSWKWPWRCVSEEFLGVSCKEKYERPCKEVAEEYRQKLYEKLREKLCENVREKFRELRAISYHWGECTSESRRDRIKSEIVLLDTGSELNNIRCISMPFDENVPAYYAISYRWGVHPEWKVQTPNYTASITSISRENLIKLCELYRRRIRYMWIDVVCINQVDKEHRKMAIKNMDNIYQRAKRIIAVPDLCYCKENPLMEDVMKEDIEAAIIWLGRNCPFETYQSPACCKLFDKNEPGTYLGYRLDVSELGKEMEPWDEDKHFFRPDDGYTELKQQQGDYEKGHDFIDRVINEWAERAWVVSERIIGVDDEKLLVHIVRANAVIYWGIYRQIHWQVNLEPKTVFETIFNSKSTKYIDRLFAIIPHTKYKDAVQNLVDEGTTIDNEQDLKNDEVIEMLPLSVREKQFQFCDPEMPYDTVEGQIVFRLEPTKQCERCALKLSCPFIYPYPEISDDTVSLWDAEDGSEMVLIYRYYTEEEEYCWSAVLHKSNGVWSAFPMYDEVSVWNCKYGEFLIFL